MTSTGQLSRSAAGTLVATSVGLGFVAWSALAVGACSDGVNSNCSGPTSYQVFQPTSAYSEIPFCTDEIEAGSGPAYVGSSQGEAGFEAGFGFSSSGSAFPGSPRISSAGLTQCATICAGATSPTPCCQSQWVPQTIVCEPVCP
jgi:hypothetical protein